MSIVAVTDYTFPDLQIETQVLSNNAELRPGQCRTAEALIPLVRDADVVITQFAPVSADVIASMKHVRAIVRYGIGVDNVDLDAARDRGIPVCNVPDYCIDEVADHTLAFVLSMTRQLRANCSCILQGKWGLGVSLEQMQALRDLTVGIVGLGRIGRAVAGRLRAFGPKILAIDPVVSSADAAALGCTLTTFRELLQQSDVVTLHCPSTAETRGLINETSLNLMKPGAVLINVGRGDLVRTEALVTALRNGQLAGAALDVFETEPLGGDSPLAAMNNVIVSSHIASASPRAVRTLRETAAKIALAALHGEVLPNVVNGVSLEKVGR
ncbi:MAG: C-terminal binding protein [Planctomycetaceae bacterium]|nr:C-terminal binding protein [Planctomycetaceae bacterium]